jgi:hypothetical protein
MNSSRTPLSPARTDPNCGQAAANGGASDAVSAGARGWRRSRQRSVGARGWKSSGRRVRGRLRLEAPSCEHIGGARLSAGKGVGGFQRRWWRRSWSCKLSACTSPSIDPLNEIMELPTKSVVSWMRVRCDQIDHGFFLFTWLLLFYVSIRVSMLV